jgi:hypothetical protein
MGAAVRRGGVVVNSAYAPPVPRPVTRKDAGPVAPDEILAYRPAQQPAAAWPLMSRLDLAALPTAVACARMHARAITLEWGLPALADNIELIVSETVLDMPEPLLARRPHVGGASYAA